MKKLFLILMSTGILFSCNSGWDPQSASSEAGSGHSSGAMKATNEKEAVVVEVVDGGTYTYLKLKDNNQEFWAAVSAREVVKGKKYFYTESVVMKNFESKHLQKTFDSIMFIDYFGEFPEKMMDATTAQARTGHTSTGRKGNISIEHKGDEISLRELFANKEKYKDELVTVRGEVVKLSTGIMDRNWIHIQDGTDHDDEYDLTVTTVETVNYGPGDIVSFKGKITLDKDFGAGYFYKVIMEDAVSVN